MERRKSSLDFFDFRTRKQSDGRVCGKSLCGNLEVKEFPVRRKNDDDDDDDD